MIRSACLGALLAFAPVAAAQTSERTLTIAPQQQAAGDARHALVIGNSSYTNGPLRNPVNDARAMAIYLKSLAQGTSPEKAQPPLPSAEASLLISLGKPIYDRECASCHGATGLGMPPHYPPLAGNQSIQMVSAVNAIRMVLNGGYPPGTMGNPEPYGMPPFAHRLSDDEVAAVVIEREGGKVRREVNVTLQPGTAHEVRIGKDDAVEVVPAGQ